MPIDLTPLSCPHCAAPLRVVPGATLQKCPYCDTSISLQLQSPPGAQVAGESWLARGFSVSAEGSRDLLHSWLASGELTPDDLLTRATVQDHGGVFVPLYRIRGEFRSTWAASSGFDHTQSTEIREKDARGHTTTRHKNRTVTDWRPVTGETSGPFDLTVSAGKHLPESLLGWLEERARSATTPLDPVSTDILGDHAVEDFGSTALDLLAPGGRARFLLQDVVHKACDERIPGDRHKDLTFHFDVRDIQAMAILHPVWLARLQYDNRVFPVGICGVDGDIRGERPEDAKRRALFQALMRPVWISGIVTGILAFLLIFLTAGIGTVLVLLVGGPLTLVLYRKANSRKKAILDRSLALRQELLSQVRGGGQGR